IAALRMYTYARSLRVRRIGGVRWPKIPAAPRASDDMWLGDRNPPPSCAAFDQAGQWGVAAGIRTGSAGVSELGRSHPSDFWADLSPVLFLRQSDRLSFNIDGEGIGLSSP